MVQLKGLETRLSRQYFSHHIVSELSGKITTGNEIWSVVDQGGTFGVTNRFFGPFGFFKVQFFGGLHCMLFGGHITYVMFFIVFLWLLGRGRGRCDIATNVPGARLLMLDLCIIYKLQKCSRVNLVECTFVTKVRKGVLRHAWLSVKMFNFVSLRNIFLAISWVIMSKWSICETKSVFWDFQPFALKLCTVWVLCISWTLIVYLLSKK